jgi:hypothetical protein
MLMFVETRGFDYEARIIQASERVPILILAFRACSQNLNIP